MWRSSSRPATAGFTLMEVLVVLASLGMILWMAGELLFPMRQAAERQRLQVEARQAARTAADYAAYVARGATDLNSQGSPPNPAAILTYLWKGANSSAGSFPLCPGDGACVQLSYNNVDQAATGFASNGTDVITLARAEAKDPPQLVSAAPWPSSFTNATIEYWVFNQFCAPGAPSASTAANDTNNFNQFKILTQDPADNSKSIPMVLWDPNSGAWLIYRITDYRPADNSTSCTVLDANCTLNGSPVPCIKVSASPQDANSLNPPGGAEQLFGLPELVVGSHFTTLRVCNGWLEQKDGPFDPSTDNNCPSLPSGTVGYPAYVTKAGWSPLLPNVEDFQVAYLYQSGQIWNRPGATLSSTEGCNDGVPNFDASTTAPTGFNIRGVVGLRITVTGRSSVPVGPTSVGKIEAQPPSAEDHSTAGLPADTFYHFQVSTTVLLRNRAAGF